MQVSARNVFAGTLTAVICGAVNAEVELTTVGGDVLVAVVTANSVQALGLAVGVSAVAYVKAPLVMLLTGGEGMRFSARNQLAGVVSALTRGAVNSEVALTLPGGTVVYAVVTNDAIKELDLREGAPATALIKASHVVLGVPFRDSHEVVARAVRHAEVQGVDIADLSLDVLRQFSALIDDDVYAVLTPEGSLAQRNHIGGTAPVQVRAQIARHRARLQG